jgi:multiple sugar transport system permease protein
MRGGHSLKKRRSRTKIWPAVITYILLLLGGALFIIPFLWMLSISFTLPAEVANAKLFPRELHWENYSNALKQMRYFHLYLKNTLIVTGLTILGGRWPVHSSPTPSRGLGRRDGNRCSYWCWRR